MNKAWNKNFLSNAASTDLAKFISKRFTCKLLSYPTLENILNKEIYGIDFDVNGVICKYLLSLHQKFNLEQSLKQVLPLYFSQHSVSHSVLDSETRSYPTVDNQDGWTITGHTMKMKPSIIYDNNFDFNLTTLFIRLYGRLIELCNQLSTSKLKAFPKIKIFKKQLWFVYDTIIRR